MNRDDLKELHYITTIRNIIGDGFQFPLKEKLRKTDWLIDQIVYRLYGLTEEEVKIVKGCGEGSGSF
jgi:hypothetical protein